MDLKQLSIVNSWNIGLEDYSDLYTMFVAHVDCFMQKIMSVWIKYNFVLLFYVEHFLFILSFFQKVLTPVSCHFLQLHYWFSFIFQFILFSIFLKIKMWIRWNLAHWIQQTFQLHRIQILMIFWLFFSVLICLLLLHFLSILTFLSEITADFQQFLDRLL